ncbi:helix-turn-helix domain-containing protein [Aquihabitans sp. G128]|uniref:helix-turn-helix domain-containing protein n=1 Tax=Aquihabitans sp. G128 TaxID=2849779 RepID=UPI001C2387B6|nr:helix-turn-helix transcriptional regulator [Aquihabitans sp. G128]QXC61619.1 helix-turn-helix domain-containing protein [Aquihabitans sp. G128]
MTQRRGVQGPPKVYLQTGVSWPSRRVRARESAPIRRAVIVSAEISQRLAEALEGRSITATAKAADVARTTVYDLLAGNSWPDVVTIMKLEEALEVTLWAPSVGAAAR